MAIVSRLAVSPLGAALALALLASAAATAGDEIVDEPAQPNVIGRADARPSIGTERTARFDDTDTLAALESISIALNEVGDGGTYAWHRRDGRLSGMAQPLGSFKNAAGLPCRRLIIMLSSFERTRRIDGVACRAASGRWQLEG